MPDPLRPARVRLLPLPLRGTLPGPEGQLPPLKHVRRIAVPRLAESATRDMRERVGRGRLGTPLPYGIQSDYDRQDRDLTLPAVELSNGLVTATVLPSLGGRVWSLVDHTRGRELLFVNPRLRFANFGLTDAWFAGGIEWNLGSTGHSTLSSRPVHAAVVEGPDGPVLRLWEWERTRDLVMQVDLWLDGPRLLASTRVVNPDPEPKPLYWWTNIAVPETPGTRVLVPATHAWRTDYTGMLDRVEVPVPDGDVDISRPQASTYAADYFYEVADQRGRLVCAVEPDGRGLAQTSTSELTGRKLFLWGTGPGGRRWQEWLSTADTRYLEIQAGVCQTQMEHDVIEGGATRSWTEAFVAVDLDPGAVGGEYAVAADSARVATHEAVSPEWLEGRHAHWLSAVAALPPGDLVQTGSGWGHAELALRGQQAPDGVVFPSVEDASAPLARFAAGEVSALSDVPVDAPTIPPVSARWERAFTTAAAGGAAGWWLAYAEAVRHHVRGDVDAARAAYRRSVDLAATAPALRGLAVLAADADERDSLYARALEMAPADRQLWTERLAALLDAGRPGALVAAVDTMPEDLRRHGRTRLLLAQALVALGEHGAALAELETLEVPDLAEGDIPTAELWHVLRPGEPVPERLDFRMSREA
ncbi:DUF5107 domain-containing protein [Phycicoccus ginsengisoli]